MLVSTLSSIHNARIKIHLCFTIQKHDQPQIPCNRQFPALLDKLCTLCGPTCMSQHQDDSSAHEPHFSWWHLSVRFSSEDQDSQAVGLDLVIGTT